MEEVFEEVTQTQSVHQCGNGMTSIKYPTPTLILKGRWMNFFGLSAFYLSSIKEKLPFFSSNAVMLVGSDVPWEVQPYITCQRFKKRGMRQITALKFVRLKPTSSSSFQYYIRYIDWLTDFLYVGCSCFYAFPPGNWGGNFPSIHLHRVEILPQELWISPIPICSGTPFEISNNSKAKQNMATVLGVLKTTVAPILTTSSLKKVLFVCLHYPLSRQILLWYQHKEKHL